MRNGHAHVLASAGAVEVAAPRVNGERAGEAIHSTIRARVATTTGTSRLFITAHDSTV